MGVWDREESGIRGGWRLELSFFHSGAVWEGAFEESELVEDIDEQTEEQEANEDREDDDPQRGAVAAFGLHPLHSRGHLKLLSGKLSRQDPVGHLQGFVHSFTLQAKWLVFALQEGLGPDTEMQLQTSALLPVEWPQLAAQLETLSLWAFQDLRP